MFNRLILQWDAELLQKKKPRFLRGFILFPEEVISLLLSSIFP
jgi:hypothetical protein